MSLTVSAATSSPLAMYRSKGPMPLHPGQSAFEAASVNALRRPLAEPAAEPVAAKPNEIAVDHTTRSPELAEMFDFMMHQFVQQQCQQPPLADTQVELAAREDGAQDKVTEQRNYASHPHLMLAV